MKITLAALLASSIFAALPAPSFAAPVDDDRASIHQAVETFRVSVIKKDRAAFMSLFLKPDIPWIGVTSDKSIARIKASKTDGQMQGPPKLGADGNPKAFIEWISESTDPVEETFDNVRIDTDGEVAQVWFDYKFKNAGYTQNWGKESWQMVKASDGWKISSVIWSMEFNPVPPPKREARP